MRLDLIDEEENIDEMLNGSRNHWYKDEERNEDTYDRQEVLSLEQERLDLISQCAKMEHEIAFMKRLGTLGKYFNQNGKPAQVINNNGSAQKDNQAGSQLHAFNNNSQQSRLAEKRFSK